MYGKGIPLFKLLGFEVKVELSWLVLAGLIIWSLATNTFPADVGGLSRGAYLWMGVAGALGLFASIVFHELCHSLVARRFGLPMDEDWGTEPRTEAAKVRLREVLDPRRTVIAYVYDFGDDWEHRLILANTRQGEPGTAYPRYVAGEGNAPPEDCGGIPGFYEKLEIVADPGHPDHAELPDNQSQQRHDSPRPKAQRQAKQKGPIQRP